MTIQLLLSYVLSVCLAVLTISVCLYCRLSRLVDVGASRKLLHILIGPIFCCSWLIFPSDESLSPYLASTIPLMSAFYFYGIGVGWIKHQHLVDTVSRSGNEHELTQGPFYYGLIHCLVCCVYWLYSPIGISSLMILCIGDGFAAIIGSKYSNSSKIPWNPQKTLIGTMTMFLSSVIGSFSLILLYSSFSLFPHFSLSELFIGCLLMSFIAAIVESAPINNIDNITVFLASTITGFLYYSK